MFYVYELRDESGRPFYVGKGSGPRMHNHEQRARRGCMSHRACKIRQIWARGGAISKVVVFDTTDEQAAFSEEIRLIAFYGREALTNKTDGGDGPSNPAPEVRAKIAAGRRGYIASPKTRELQRLAKLGTHRTPETKAKIAASLRGRKNPSASLPRSEEYKRAMSIACAGKVNSPETRSRISASKMGHLVSEETRSRISTTKKGTTPWNKGRKAV